VWSSIAQAGDLFRRHGLPKARRVRGWKKFGSDHAKEHVFCVRGLCSLRAITAWLVKNPIKPLGMRRKRRMQTDLRQYYLRRKSSHFAQKSAVKLAKFRRNETVKV
jgi:hypothetical protein